MQNAEQPDPLSLVVDIGSVEEAINRCNQVLGRSSVTLSSDASEMATVYGLMIYTRRHEWPLSELSAPQRAAFMRWRVLTGPVVDGI